MEPTPPQPSDRPRRALPLVLVGSLGALLAGAIIAWVMVRADSGSSVPPPASEAGLVIDSSTSDDGRIDPAKPLRCFVQGQFVGELSLTNCALRNGVATDALDVGIDESGALAAAEQALVDGRCDIYHREHLSPSLRRGLGPRALDTLIASCSRSVANRELLIAALRLVQRTPPVYEVGGERAVYDLSGQGLPYDRYVLERIERRWYIAE